jgi:sarcosine oxidase
VTDTAAVVGGGVIGLSVARGLALDGFAVTVYEQHAVGTPLGGSPGGSRIYRTSYRKPVYVRLAQLAIEEWQRLDPALLLPNGLLELGSGIELHAAAMDECDEPYRWLEPADAHRLFPEAHFRSDVLYSRDAGVILADRVLATLRAHHGVVVQEGERVDPRALQADVVCVCPGAWLGELFDLPVHPQIEQVGYFEGAPDSRPCLIDHGGDDGRYFYAVPTPGVGLKVAQDSARPGPFDLGSGERPVDQDVLATLLEYLPVGFPGLDPRPLKAEACMYTMTSDGDFVLDTIDGMIVVGGDSGHAFKFAPLLGRYVADMARGRALPPECEMFRVSRFAGG